MNTIDPLHIFKPGIESSGVLPNVELNPDVEALRKLIDEAPLRVFELKVADQCEPVSVTNEAVNPRVNDTVEKILDALCLH